jgi:hypothetical protein
MSETDTLSDSTGSIEEATAAFEKFLGGDEPNPEVDDEEAGQDEADEAPETSEDDAEEGDEEDGEEDADADADEDDEEALPLDTPVTVKIDGKEVQVTLKEAIDGYQRQADYSRKTMELARAREVFGQEVQQVRQERAQYAQMLNALGQQLQSEPEQIDWERLKQTDPLEYAIKREEARDKAERMQAIQQEQMRLQQLQAIEQVEVLQHVVQEQRSKLLEAVPTFQDTQKWEKARADMREYGKRIGFSDEELSQAYDHRAVVALYKAMQYDRLMAKTSKDKAQPVNRSSAPAPVAPGPKNSTPRRTTELTRAKQRLAKTGSIQDAAAAFEKLL